MPPPPCRIYRRAVVLYDPFVPRDSRPCRPAGGAKRQLVKVPFCTHEAIRVVLKSGAFATLIAAMLEGDGPGPAFWREFRGRRSVPKWQRALLAAASGRGRHRLVIRAAEAMLRMGKDLPEGRDRVHPPGRVRGASNAPEGGSGGLGSAAASVLCGNRGRTPQRGRTAGMDQTRAPMMAMTMGGRGSLLPRTLGQTITVASWARAPVCPQSRRRPRAQAHRRGLQHHLPALRSDAELLQPAALADAVRAHRGVHQFLQLVLVAMWTRSSASIRRCRTAWWTMSPG